MPCLDGGPRVLYGDVEQERRQDAEKKIKSLEAMLCGVLTALEKLSPSPEEASPYDQVLATYDESEAGVSKKELSAWWTKHKKEDEARRKREEAKRELERVRKNALRKLSPDEKRALGIK